MSKSNVTFLRLLIAVAMNVGCANTVRGVQQDASEQPRRRSLNRDGGCQVRPHCG